LISVPSVDATHALPQCRGCYGTVAVEVSHRNEVASAGVCDVCHENHTVVASETDIRRRIASVAVDYRVRHDSHYRAMLGAYLGYALDPSPQKLAKADSLLAYLQLKYPQYRWGIPVGETISHYAVIAVFQYKVMLDAIQLPHLYLLPVDDPPLPLVGLALMFIPLYLLYRQQRRSPPDSDDYILSKRINQLCCAD
jgi:hypothetical protein